MSPLLIPEKDAEARIHQARSGYLPRLQFSESLQRSNNPVFMFSSLLTQHQFTEGNFATDTLNHPDPLNNYESRLMVEQVVFDTRQTSRSVEAARVTRQMAGEDTRRSHSDIILNVLRTYFGVTLAEKNLEVAQQSVESAQANLERAALNDALGVSLDRAFELTTPLESPAAAPEATLEEYRRLGAENRSEMRQAQLAQRLAQTQQQIAGAAYWPQVVFQGIVEADRQNFHNKGGANWFTAVTLRWSLWNGGETKARVEQARFAESRAGALSKHADSAIRLEVRTAYLDLRAAA